MLLVLLSGCLAARLTQGTVGSFDVGESAHAEGHTDVDIGVTGGAFEITVGGHLRASPQGVELAAVPMGCLAAPMPSAPVGIGGCVGLTLIGGGTHDGRPSLLFAGPEAQVYASWAPWSPDRTLGDLFEDAQSGEPALFLRGGLVVGHDVRIGAPDSTYVGVFVGVELWTKLLDL